MATRNWLETCNNGVETGLVQDVWVSIETGGFGDEAVGGVFPVADDAIEHLGIQLNYTQAREDSEARSGRSLATRLTGKIETTWESSFYIVPSDPTGGGSDEPGLPDIHPFIYGLFGAYDDVSSAQEIVYSFVACNTVSLRAYVLGLQYSQLAIGMVCNEGTFELPGDGIAKFSVSGFAQSTLDAQRGEIQAPVVSANDIVVGTGQGQRFDVGSYVDVVNGANNANIASERLITAIVGDTITVDGAVIVAAAGDLVTPVCPVSSGINSSDKAMTGLAGEVSIAGIGVLDCQVLNAEVSINNNFTPVNNRYGTDRICGFLNDVRREVTVSMELEFNTSTYDIYRRAKRFETADVTVKLKPQNGDSEIGRTFTFNLPKVELDIPEIASEADSVVTIPFEARALSSAVDSPDTELTLTIGPA